jgi:hypothetical protein
MGQNIEDHRKGNVSLHALAELFKKQGCQAPQIERAFQAGKPGWTAHLGLVDEFIDQEHC